MQLMQEFPSLIRRPVIETDDEQLLIGLNTALYTSFLSPSGTTE